ncbi:hypothetical protein L9F63_011308 [Diploptera punctata]|uniref:BRCT domain-containing protein n=1 Tax=Diploptera punctata TaxID=6984 RepID=A0AAD8AET9_DIPPU|nr:hypothetical protein L9F63_011308 [Diploptera punctata]
MLAYKEILIPQCVLNVYSQNIPEDPVNYSMCGHFCCKTCIKSKKNSCPVCGLPSLSSEITSDHLISNLISGMKIISDTIGIKSSVDDVKSQSCDASEGDKSSKPSGKRSSEECREISPHVETKEKKPRNSRSKNTATRRSVKTLASRNSEAKNVNKRNAKGETQLHTACIKGRTDLVKEYLEAGANPNTKDYAGWTPLLGFVNHGFIKIVELLLQFGAMVNVPGCENITPLHEAVSGGKLEIAKLLITYGADLEVRNIYGVIPRELTLTDEMKQVLNSASTITILKPIVETKPKKMEHHEMMIFSCDLDKEQQKQLVTFSNKFQIKILQKFAPEVTHIIVSADANNVCSSNRDVLHGILQGKWIINFDWIILCLETVTLIDPDAYEVKGTRHFPKSGAPMRGRINVEKQLPGILNGCHIFFAGLSSDFTVDNYKLTKADMLSLIRSGDGIILSREPDPEGIPLSECTVPYHASSGSSLSKCSHYIIYRRGRDEPKLKYNMAHIKSLPLQWLLNSLESFTLVEP